MVNPHFDHHRVIWKDEYSGQYDPVEYSSQFDAQWRLFLERQEGFTRHAGVETDDAWIDDRIFDLTGTHGLLAPTAAPSDRSTGGKQPLDLRFSVDFFRGKRCIDIACGAGRWTRAIQSLGGNVKSIDVSERGLESVRRFNSDVERLNLFDIADRPDLHGKFEFALAWGVVMSTHDPSLAFANAARTVAAGGGLYVMVYAPTLHASPEILKLRAEYHARPRSMEEKLRFVYEAANHPGNAINYHDMLNPFYNWVVEEETIHAWYRQHGFTNVVTLNASERYPVAYHVFGTRRAYARPQYDDRGERVPEQVTVDESTLQPLVGPFRREHGFAWQVPLPQFADVADDMSAPTRSPLVVLEDGKVLAFRHTQHADIRAIGRGAFSHWGHHLILSTSDNSDPNANGRLYQIAVTK